MPTGHQQAEKLQLWWSILTIVVNPRCPTDHLHRLLPANVVQSRRREIGRLRANVENCCLSTDYLPAKIIFQRRITDPLRANAIDPHQSIGLLPTKLTDYHWLTGRLPVAEVYRLHTKNTVGLLKRKVLYILCSADLQHAQVSYRLGTNDLQLAVMQRNPWLMKRLPTVLNIYRHLRQVEMWHITRLTQVARGKVQCPETTWMTWMVLTVSTGQNLYRHRLPAEIWDVTRLKHFAIEKVWWTEIKWMIPVIPTGQNIYRHRLQAEIWDMIWLKQFASGKAQWPEMTRMKSILPTPQNLYPHLLQAIIRLVDFASGNAPWTETTRVVWAIPTKQNLHRNLLPAGVQHVVRQRLISSKNAPWQ